MMIRFFPIATIVSVLFAIPFAILNVAAVLSDGAEISSLFELPQFTGVLIYAWAWFMACSFVSSCAAFWVFTRVSKAT